MLSPNISALFVIGSAAVVAVLFHCPQLFYCMVRVIIQHRRDRAASRALRLMRYTDIR